MDIKSGSGKTSLAKVLINSKKLKKKNWIHIDGDVIRKIFNDTKNFSISNRRNNASRISNIVKLLNDYNYVMFLITISILVKWNRKI